MALFQQLGAALRQTAARSMLVSQLRSGAPAFAGIQNRMQSNKIFVGGLPYEMTEEDLRAQFERFGEIDEVVIPLDRATGRGKGFGFVQFTDAEHAQAAQELDGSDLGGRPLRVDLAKEREPRTRDGGSYGGGRGGYGGRREGGYGGGRGGRGGRDRGGYGDRDDRRRNRDDDDW